MLQAKGLTCGYGSKVVLEDVDFSVEPGAFLGILGPNGSGKTTLLKALTRLLEPKRGEVLFGGKNIWDISLREFAREFAAVSQSVSAVPVTVEEYVALGRTPHYRDFQFLEGRKDFEIVAEAMRVTGVEVLADRLMTQLSGGERQLAAIARALAQEPRWLVLDEPTAHLDIAHQIRILDLLKRLNHEKKITIVIVHHDLNLVSEYCDRILLISEGKIFKGGSPEEVLTYANIEAVYKTVVIVNKNPISSKPFVLLVPAERNKK
ncbi:MAG TPA: ABC transporter ATP-binding protein [Candidatus Omnitrophota bacterium]|nr:ABC transporter ATP-binding protein [Candidatus Omnitrophota bacterium]HPS37558.1 ABC transporter ATP-binding protein [Candidatus Omnitrophota bacterium]